MVPPLLGQRCRPPETKEPPVMAVWSAGSQPHFLQVRDRSWASIGRAHPIPSALITVATPARATQRLAFRPTAPKSIQRPPRCQACTTPRLSVPRTGRLLVLFLAFQLLIVVTITQNLNNVKYRALCYVPGHCAATAGAIPLPRYALSKCLLKSLASLRARKSNAPLSFHVLLGLSMLESTPAQRRGTRI